MMNGEVRDHCIDYRLKHHFVSARDLVTGATASTGGPATLTAGYTNGSVVPPQLWGIGSVKSGYMGLRIATTAATINYVWRPWDVDNTHPVYLRHWWTCESELANVATFSTFFSTISTGLIMATPTTAITRQPTSEAKDAAANEPTWTRLGSISPLATGAFANQTLSPEIQAVIFAFHVATLSHGTIGTSPVIYLGMELLYTPKLTFGDGSRRQARYIEPILSDMEASPAIDFKNP